MPSPSTSRPLPRGARPTCRSPTAMSCASPPWSPASSRGACGPSLVIWCASGATCCSSSGEISVAASDRPLFPLRADPTCGQPTPPGGSPPPPIIDAEFSAAPRHLRESLWVLHKYRWLAATCFGLTFGLTVFVPLVTPRLYSASTRLQLAGQSPIQLRVEGNVLRLDDGDPSANGAATFLSTRVAALQSRDLAERVIRSRGLADSEAFLDPGSRRRGLLSLGGTMLRLVRPRGLETAPTRPSADGSAGRGSVDPVLLDRYMRYLSVQEVRGTDLVAVAVTTPSPSLSALLAAAHTQAYLEANEEIGRAHV